MGSWAGCAESREGMAGPLGRGPGLGREGRSGKVRGREGETGNVFVACSAAAPGRRIWGVFENCSYCGNVCILCIDGTRGMGVEREILQEGMVYGCTSLEKTKPVRHREGTGDDSRWIDGWSAGTSVRARLLSPPRGLLHFTLLYFTLFYFIAYLQDP